MRIGEIESSAEYQMDEHFKFLEPDFGFPICKKFVNFPIWKAPEIFNYENSKNSKILQFGKFRKSSI